MASRVLSASVVVACSLWAATGILLLLTPDGQVWKWTALASVAALLVAGAAVAFGQQRPAP